MKIGILAGGFGTRLSEETEVKPKPMVEIGGRPILWHIMMTFYHYGYSDFAIALGYKGEYIKRWMRDYAFLYGNMTVNTGLAKVTGHDSLPIEWNVDLVDTGLSTLTGGRVQTAATLAGRRHLHADLRRWRLGR